MLFNGRMHACTITILFVINILDHGVLVFQFLYLNVLYSLNKLGNASEKYWKYVFFVESVSVCGYSWNRGPFGILLQ